MKITLTIIFAVVAQLGLGVVAASADSILVPQEWAGIWQSEITEMDCETMEVLGSSTSLDTLCTGEAYGPDDFVGSPFEILCEGTLSGTDVHLECSSSGIVLPGCAVSFSWVTDITRSSSGADVAQGVDIFMVNYEGGACFLQDSCERKEYTFTRIDDDSSCTFTAAAGQTWGALKGIYR